LALFEKLYLGILTFKNIAKQHIVFLVSGVQLSLSTLIVHLT